MKYFLLNYISDKNNKLALGLLTIVFAMLLLAYASVPLYDLFCKVTGFGGTPNITQIESEYVLDKTIEVRFDANVSSDLNWDFYPEEKTYALKIGADYTANYIAKNNSHVPISGTASFNVSPNDAGKYFSKMECFCFNEQSLQPGEQRVMPINFYIDPEIVNDKFIGDLSEITLSYTFYETSDNKNL
jgi:cytochrome c oxidase assembly protein subunit 11|tara:strand:+ start:2300 stop:2860 length:561 start_codon:yes stop_codon:yes gene_type:complete